jgi:hypothetical protein
MQDPVFGFTRKDAEALLRLINEESSQSANVTDTYDATACYLGVATSAITAYNATTLTLGNGQAQFKAISSAGVISNTWSGTVYNFGTAIPDSARLMIWRVGDKHIAVEIC